MRGGRAEKKVRLSAVSRQVTSVDSLRMVPWSRARRSEKRQSVSQSVNCNAAMSTLDGSAWSGQIRSGQNRTGHDENGGVRPR